MAEIGGVRGNCTTIEGRVLSLLKDVNGQGKAITSDLGRWN